MELKFKRLSERAVLPTRAHKSDAGLDLTCAGVTTELNECGQLILMYHTDIAVEIPEGYVGLVFPRSSVYKKSLALTNSVGVIDSGYRGEIKVAMKVTTDVVPAIYKMGERFAQLVIVPIPEIEVVETEELTPSDRNEGGFGSTDIDSAAEGNSPEQVQPSEEVEKPAEDLEIQPAAGATESPEVVE